MLVLTRKVGEEIVIGANIHVVVVAVQGETVRIGISAPKDVIVDRQEVAERRKQWLRDEPALVEARPAADRVERLCPPPA